jgi:hypothetical protein
LVANCGGVFWRDGPHMSAHDKDATPAERLRAEMSVLDEDAARSERILTTLETQMRIVEMRAMDAIRSGNDQSAHVNLLEQRDLAEQADEIRADLKVVRAILDECNAVLRETASPRE